MARFAWEPLSENEAVVLFEANLADRSPHEELDVRAIVRRLDALPPFVLQAAAKTSILSVEQLRARLDRSLDLLDLSPVTVQMSKLSADERRVLSQLAIFPGSFTLEACEAMLGPAPLRALEALHEASLLRRVEDRLALYQVVRAVTPVAGELSSAHADYHLDRLEPRCGRSRCLTDAAAVELLLAEQDDLLAIHARSDPQRAARAALLLDALYSIRGPFERHVEILTASIDTCVELRAPLLRARGEALRARRRLIEARRDLEEALSLATDRELETLCLQELGILEREEGEKSGALLERALHGARSLGLRPLEGIILGNLGTLHRYLGEIGEARALYQEALSIHRDAGNRRSEMIALGNLGHLYVLEEKIDEARACYRASLSILDEVSDPRSEAIILAHLGGLEAWRGDPAVAEWLFTRALALASRLGDRPLTSVCHAELGALDAVRNRIDEGRRRFGEAKRLLHPLDVRGWPAAISVLEGFVDLAAKDRERAQQRIDDLAEDSHAAHTEFLRLAVVRLFEALRPPDVLPPQASAVELARDGSWFRASEQRTSLERRKPLKRILARLIEERAEHPNEVVSLASIVRAGWPGEELIPHSATTRAYVAISTLRRLGLKDALVSRDGGYLLLASVPIVFSDP